MRLRVKKPECRPQKMRSLLLWYHLHLFIQWYILTCGKKRLLNTPCNIQVTACALELYNEDLLDLSMRSGREELASKNGWDTVRASMGLKLQERPVGKDGRVVPEVSEDVHSMRCDAFVSSPLDTWHGADEKLSCSCL